MENRFVLHQDIVSAYTTLSVKQFLVDKHITTLERPYTLWHHVTFFLLFKLKCVFKRTYFELLVAKQKTADVLKQPTETDLLDDINQ